MKEYKVKASDTRHFKLTLDDRELGSLEYESWFSFKSTMNLTDGESCLVVPKGFWGTTIEVKQNDQVLLNFKLNWSGNIIIHTMFDQSEADYVFKYKSFFKNAYVLLNTEEEELLIVQPDFKWSKFNYDYNIQTTDSFDRLNHNKVLLLTSIHCVNYFMTMLSSAV